DGSAVIRFGLGAVKNVGQAAVEATLKARSSAPFTSLNDFARRVDLRQVGRRALECLTKVGALDHFGARPAILEALDRIISVSASHFRAAETGQMSLFGEHTGVVEEVDLPAATTQFTRREILDWERELIGLYVSDHPLSPVMDILQDVITHYSGQLAEASPEERVRVAGLITRIRRHQTKAGKSMAFATLEDLQGAIDLVIFPSTWEKVREIIEIDRPVLVDGRIDAQSTEPKILVDNITAEFERKVSLDAPPAQPAASAAPATRPQRQQPAPAAARPGSMKPATREPATPYQPETPWIDEFVAPEPDFPDAPDWDEMPPLPEAPPSWEDSLWNELPENAPSSGSHFAPAAPQAATAPRAEPPPTPPVVSPIPRKSSEGMQTDGLSGLPPYLVSPTPAEGDEGGVRMLTAILRSTGDKTRDVLRLRRIHGLVTSYPGRDRFAVHVFERGRGYLLEFPNFTTGICPELVERMNALLGAENVRVEPITFQ
ncbi:MAG: hypothetical protein JXA78_02355, partial [Anaerolineales bacterium]|nr:hypothetical protein [Anaerolineales bacterium]